MAASQEFVARGTRQEARSSRSESGARSAKHKAQKEKKSLWESLLPPPAQLRATGAALLVVFAEQIIPIDQLWMYATPLLYWQRDFSSAVYSKSWLVTVFTVLCPWFPLRYTYPLCMLYDYYRRKKLAEILLDDDHFSFSSYLGQLLVLRVCFGSVDPQPLVTFLESFFGPVRSWYWIVLPAQGVLMIPDNRAPLNGFVPEGKQGIPLALLLHLCSGVVPCWLQWTCYLAFSRPARACPFLLFQWVLASACWFYEAASPTVAYLLLLVMNQFPHADARRDWLGGRHPAVLRREREGTLWLGGTMLLLQIFVTILPPDLVWNLVLAGLLVYLLTGPELLLRIPYVRRLMTPWLKLPVCKFTHEDLKELDEFRLLRLLPQACAEESPILCEMIHDRILTNQSYVAISYCWGSPKKKQMKEIIINGGSFKVSPNVFSLLLEKRSPLGKRLRLD